MSGPVIHRPALPIPLPLSRGGLAATTAAGGRSTLGLGTAAVEDLVISSFTCTGTGFSGTAPSVTATYLQIDRFVAVSVPNITGTSNSTTFTITGFPAAIEAVPGTGFVAWMSDGLSYIVGFVGNPFSGGFGVFLDIGGTPWPTSGFKGLFNLTMTYLTI